VIKTIFLFKINNKVLITICHKSLNNARKFFYRDEEKDPLQSKQDVSRCIFILDDARVFKFEKEQFIYRGLAEVYKREIEPETTKEVKLEVPDDDSDSECADHQDKVVEDKDGKKVNVPKRRRTK
jgi:hypothetical protein